MKNRRFHTSADWFFLCRYPPTTSAHTAVGLCVKQGCSAAGLLAVEGVPADELAPVAARGFTAATASALGWLAPGWLLLITSAVVVGRTAPDFSAASGNEAGAIVAGAVLVPALPLPMS